MFQALKIQLHVFKRGENERGRPRTQYLDPLPSQGSPAAEGLARSLNHLAAQIGSANDNSVLQYLSRRGKISLGGGSRVLCSAADGEDDYEESDGAQQLHDEAGTADGNDAGNHAKRPKQTPRQAKVATQQRWADVRQQFLLTATAGLIPQVGDATACSSCETPITFAGVACFACSGFGSCYASLLCCSCDELVHALRWHARTLVLLSTLPPTSPQSAYLISPARDGCQLGPNNFVRVIQSPAGSDSSIASSSSAESSHPLTSSQIISIFDRGARSYAAEHYFIEIAL